MKKSKLIFSILMLLFPYFVFAQEGGYTSQFWKTTRYEVIFGAGTNVFMGDLGGGEGEGKGWFAMKDMDLAATRPVLQVGGRYKVLKWASLKGGLTYARLVGDDAKSADLSRGLRNLNFRSNVWEASLQLELSFLTENRGKRYIFQRNSIWNNMNAYVFGGIAGFAFNPKAKYEGKKYNLHDLGTEGQNVEGGPEPYKLTSLAIPMGIGFKYYLTRNWNVGFEAGFRYTYTDYIDDVGGLYFDNSKLSPEAALIADRHIIWNEDPVYSVYGGVDASTFAPYPGGWRRASTDHLNDAYLFLIFNLTYTFENKVKRAKFQKRPAAF
jgi:hypothetical protein